MGTLCGGEVGSTGPQGDRQGCRFLFVRIGVLSKSPAAPRRLAGHGCPASAKRGGLLFGLLFSWPRKRKVTRPPVADESPPQASTLTRSSDCRSRQTAHVERQKSNCPASTRPSPQSSPRWGEEVSALRRQKTNPSPTTPDPNPHPTQTPSAPRAR